MSGAAGGSRPEPLLLATAVLSGLDVLLAGAAFGDLIGATALGLAVLGTKAINVGMAVYVRGKVTPIEDPHDDLGRRLVPAKSA